MGMIGSLAGDHIYLDTIKIPSNLALVTLAELQDE